MYGIGEAELGVGLSQPHQGLEHAHLARKHVSEEEDGKVN